ncbi:DUF7824 domain-containing protein [Streptomyces griseoaurantiacus]|uniref:DUF7824 domain-containing protein n=1 Tax=Streptomyces griseoaurantiacus TaxID=68213 RepID=UPI00363FEB27
MPDYDIPAGAAPGAHALLHAVREGRAEDVAKLASPLTAAERRACLPVLKAWRKEVRDDRTEGHLGIREALWAAGAACSSGVAAAAQWLAAGELWWSSRDLTPVLDALGDREPAWLGQVAHRMAERRTVARDQYPLIAALVQAAGCEPPTTDGFVLGWELCVGGSPVRKSLGEHPFLTVMVPRLFEVPEAGSNLQYVWDHDPGWAAALAGLAEEGRLSRGMLLDGCVSRLSRETRLGLVRGFLTLLTALDPTEDEYAARTLTWVRMVPDAQSLAAARAQEVLARLDAAGRLETEHLVEASRAALTRPEKKIVRAQLTLLDKAVKRGGPGTEELLLAVTDVFAHEEHSLQERGLALLIRHRKRAGGAVLAAIAASAGQLRPDLRARAAEAFGDVLAEETAGIPEGDDEDEGLPPAPLPEPLEPEPLSLAELVEEIAAVPEGSGAPVRQERVLGALVRHAHADLPGLRAALEPVVGRWKERWYADGHYYYLGWHWLPSLLASVMGAAPEEELAAARSRVLESACPHRAVGLVPLLRVAEIAARLHTDPLPFLLATPTWSTGTIDPAVLVERLAAYERAGTAPGPADLDLALLRLDREVPPGVVAAAAELTSPAGRRLAARLAEGPLPDPAVFRERQRLGLRTPRPGVLVRTEAVAGHEDFSEPFRSLLGVYDPLTGRCRCGDEGGELSTQLLALLPQHREIVAARMLVRFAWLAYDESIGEAADVLPVLAESGGPAGPATHLLLAYGLGARRPEERLSAVDAMLVLAARGQLDTERLGRDVAELTQLRRLTLQRVVEALRELVRTGAYATAWAVLSAVLPPLLADEAPHGLPAVLTLAADSAEGCGARGSVPGLDALAARPGSSQTVKQARRLKNALDRTD